MPKIYKQKKNKEHIAVIGSGFAGLTLTRKLLKSGFLVTLFSGRKNCASDAAIGLFGHKGSVIANSLPFAEEMRGARSLRRLILELETEQQVKISCGSLGSYEFFSTRGEYEKIKQRAFHKNFSGLSGALVLSRDQLLQFFESEARIGSWQGAFFYPQDSWVDSLLLRKTLLKSAKNLGLKVVDEDVSAIGKNDGLGVKIIAGSESFSFDRFVLAAGAYSFSLLSKSAPIFESNLLNSYQLVKGKSYRVLGDFKKPLAQRLGKDALIVRPDMIRFSEDFPLSKSTIKETELCAKEEFYGQRVLSQDRLPKIEVLCKENGQCNGLLITGFYKNGLVFSDIFADKALVLLGKSNPEIG